jgi:hypothetical protein
MNYNIEWKKKNLCLSWLVFYILNESLKQLSQKIDLININTMRINF